jgi:tetratricopeptide (TPR) repeat protein
MEAAANCAASLVNDGRYQECLDRFERLSDIAHRNLLLNLLEASTRLKNETLGSSLCATLLDLFPKDREVLAKIVNSAETLRLFSFASDAGVLYLEVADQKSDVEALTTISYLSGRCGKKERALELAERAIAIDPSHGYAHYNAAINSFKLEKYSQAWKHNQWRFVPKGHEYQFHPLKKEGYLKKPSDYDAISFYGKKVLFSYEQGIGDELFFLRFLDSIEKLGAEISYLPSEKSRQIVNFCSGFKVWEVGDRLPDFDYIFPVGEAALFATTIGITSTVPPILFDDEKVSNSEIPLELLNAPKPWVGLTWRAGIEAEYNQLRQIDLGKLVEAIPSEGTLVVLQRHAPADEVERLRSMGRVVLDFTELNEHLDRLVPVIGALDDYIGIHNTNMHIRASFGKRACLLNAYPGDSILSDGINESGWFPTFTIYSEKEHDQWGGALENLSRDLIEMDYA